LVGGQKAIERTLGLPKRTGFEEMDGAEAVLLWHRYLRGDEHSLSRLIDYNRYDVLGMCGILDEVMDRLDVHPDLLFRRPRFAAKSYEPQKRASSDAPQRNAGQWNASPSFDALFRGTAAEHATVIGIDLTGSETRPSGWCVLRGSEADTDMIASDDEIFARAQGARADRPNRLRRSSRIPSHRREMAGYIEGIPRCAGFPARLLAGVELWVDARR
jgi:hypothetical protein